MADSDLLRQVLSALQCAQQGDASECADAIAALSTALQEAAVQANGYELTRSIIHECPALKLPQSFVQRLGMTAQILPLKGFTREQAEVLLADLNATPVQATPAGEPVGWLVKGGRTYVDKVHMTREHAERSIAERKDGAQLVPLYASPIPQQSGSASAASQEGVRVDAPNDRQCAEAWASWDEAERISNLPAVEEAIGNLLENQTGDNATCLVRAVLEAAAAVQSSHGEVQQKDGGQKK